MSGTIFTCLGECAPNHVSNFQGTVPIKKTRPRVPFFPLCLERCKVDIDFVWRSRPAGKMYKVKV